MGNRCCCSNSSANASASPNDHEAKGATSSSKRSIKNPHASDGATRLPERGGNRRGHAPEPIELSDTTMTMMMNMNVSSDERLQQQLPDVVAGESGREDHHHALEVVNSSEVEEGQDDVVSLPHANEDPTTRTTTPPPMGQISSDSLSVGVAVNSSGGGSSSGTGSHLADLVPAGRRSMPPDDDDGTGTEGSSRISSYPDPSLAPAAPIWSTTSTTVLGSQGEANLQCSAISFGYSLEERARW